QYDIIDVRDRSRSMLWFEEAQEVLTDSVVPAWLQVVPESLRILVHQLPERAQIDIPLQEQLIVEFYSK
ncbi:MAG: 30S ribosomal protein S4, partial [Acidipropionibacterium jensenii]|nr:30S ribosomal protein S4 [Acidipropionibacterium jensenii]